MAVILFQLLQLPAYISWSYATKHVIDCEWPWKHWIPEGQSNNLVVK